MHLIFVAVGHRRNI